MASVAERDVREHNLGVAIEALEVHLNARGGRTRPTSDAGVCRTRREVGVERKCMLLRVVSDRGHEDHVAGERIFDLCQPTGPSARSSRCRRILSSPSDREFGGVASHHIASRNFRRHGMGDPYCAYGERSQQVGGRRTRIRGETGAIAYVKICA